MLEKSQDILRLALAAAAILVGSSVAYRYAIYLPQKDREAREKAEAKEAADQRQEAEKSKQAEKTALERRTSYRICLSSAQANYDSRWQLSCKALATEADKERAQCVARGYDPNVCEGYYPARPAQDCRLPNKTASDYDEALKIDKERCLSEVNNGLADPL